MNIMEQRDYVWLFYFLLVNVYGLSIVAIDKYKARKGKWRIKEKKFFITALLGGAAGVYIGMNIWRHKTKHKSFQIGIPALLMINIACVILYGYYVV
ncbi:MAG: DUF1294 domain-containing protein [Bacillota bacterium]